MLTVSALRTTWLTAHLKEGNQRGNTAGYGATTLVYNNDSSRFIMFARSSKIPDSVRRYKECAVTLHCRPPTTPQPKRVRGSATEVLQGKCPRPGISAGLVFPISTYPRTFCLRIPFYLRKYCLQFHMMSSNQASTPRTAFSSIPSPSVNSVCASAQYAANLERFNQTKYGLCQCMLWSG